MEQIELIPIRAVLGSGQGENAEEDVKSGKEGEIEEKKSKSDITSFLDPKVAKHFRRAQIMTSLDFSVKAWIVISMVSSAIHHINEKPGNFIQRGMYPMFIAFGSWAVKHLIVRYKWLEKFLAQMLLATYMLAVTELSIFMSPNEYRFPSV